MRQPCGTIPFDPKRFPDDFLKGLVEETVLEPLAVRDVDEDALEVDLARVGIDAAVRGVDDRPDLPVRAPDLELEVPDGPVALEDEQFGLAP